MNLTERGYCDKILRVDLTTGTIESTPLPAEQMPLLLGGKGLGAWLLYTEQPAGVDPLGPDNHLIFHTGPLTGTTAPTAGRFGVTTQSPATGTYFDAYCGGYWGQMLKYAGYDALVVSGASEFAALIVIEEDEIVRIADLDCLDQTHSKFAQAFKQLIEGVFLVEAGHDNGQRRLCRTVSVLAGILNSGRCIRHGDTQVKQE